MSQLETVTDALDHNQNGYGAILLVEFKVKQFLGYRRSGCTCKTFHITAADVGSKGSCVRRRRNDWSHMQHWQLGNLRREYFFRKTSFKIIVTYNQFCETSPPITVMWLHSRFTSAWRATQLFRNYNLFSADAIRYSPIANIRNRASAAEKSSIK